MEARPAVALNALYGEDPLRLIAGYDLTTYYTLDEDLWDVWICEVAEGNLDLAPEEVVGLLESEITPYFDWLSGAAIAQFSGWAGQWKPLLSTIGATASARYGRPLRRYRQKTERRAQF